VGAFMLYGSERVGSFNDTTTLLEREVEASISGGEVTTSNPSVTYEANLNPNRYRHEIGRRQYEIKNHLGNVLATVSDARIPHDAGTDGNIDFYTPVVKSAQDYYPFGMQMPGRKIKPNSYKFGYQGYEKDNNVAGQGNSYDTKFRQYDARLGRWWSLDPKASKYPAFSDYAANANNPIVVIDEDGDAVATFTAIAIGVAAGAGASYGVQATTNYAGGDDLMEAAVKNIDYLDVIVSGVAGGLTGGMGAYGVVSKAAYTAVGTGSGAASGGVNWKPGSNEGFKVNSGESAVRGAIRNVVVPKMGKHMKKAAQGFLKKGMSDQVMNKAKKGLKTLTSKGTTKGVKNFLKDKGLGGKKLKNAMKNFKEFQKQFSEESIDNMSKKKVKQMVNKLSDEYSKGQIEQAKENRTKVPASDNTRTTQTGQHSGEEIVEEED
jgi:RHS repeat-associated protein